MQPIKQKLQSKVAHHMELARLFKSKLDSLKTDSIAKHGRYVRTSEIAIAQKKLKRQRYLLNRSTKNLQTL